jgi:hypothetical protein
MWARVSDAQPFNVNILITSKIIDGLLKIEKFRPILCRDVSANTEQPNSRKSQTVFESFSGVYFCSSWQILLMVLWWIWTVNFLVFQSKIFENEYVGWQLVRKIFKIIFFYRKYWNLLDFLSFVEMCLPTPNNQTVKNHKQFLKVFQQYIFVHLDRFFWWCLGFYFFSLIKNTHTSTQIFQALYPLSWYIFQQK